MIFRMISEESRKILKLNKFWFKNVAETVVLKRDRFNVVIHEVKIKKIFQDIKNEKARIVKKA